MVFSVVEHAFSTESLLSYLPSFQHDIWQSLKSQKQVRNANVARKFLSEEHSIEEIRDALEHNFNRISDRFWIMSRMVDPIRIIWDEIEIKRSTRES